MSRLRRNTFRVLVVGAVVAALVLLGVLLLRREVAQLVAPRTAEMRAAQRLLTELQPHEASTVLVLGSDHRRSTSEASDRRSDTIMLVRIDPNGRSLRTASIPRDLEVSVPGVGQTKISDALALGGAELALETVQDATGLDVHALVVIDFTGFRALIDDVDGVWVDVDRRYYVPPEAGYEAIDLQPGEQYLNGDDALDYARFRRDARGDAGRIERQQQVLDALRERLDGEGAVRSARRLIGLLTEHGQVIVGGPDGGRIELRVLEELARVSIGLDGDDVQHIAYGGPVEHPNGGTIVPWDSEAMDEMVQALANGSTAR